MQIESMPRFGSGPDCGPSSRGGHRFQGGQSVGFSRGNHRLLGSRPMTTLIPGGTFSADWVTAFVLLPLLGIGLTTGVRRARGRAPAILLMSVGCLGLGFAGGLIVLGPASQPQGRPGSGERTEPIRMQAGVTPEPARRP